MAGRGIAASGPSSGPRPDAVVVLGAAVIAPGVPGPALVRRLHHGVAVFRRSGARHLVVSGGIVEHPPAEADLMRRLALDLGVADDAIVAERRARNTFENALFVGSLARRHGWRRLTVITDGWHLRRSLYVFRRLGLEVSGEGVPRPADTSWRDWSRASLADTVRLLNCAWLFAIGRHRSAVAAERARWHGEGSPIGDEADRPAGRRSARPGLQDAGPA